MVRARVALERLGLALEHLDELAADDLALGLGVAHALERPQELLARIDMHDLGMQAPSEHVHHQLRLVQAQQAVVDEHAGELVTDGAVDQRGRHARVDAARQAEDHLLAAHLRADALDRLGDVVAHDPVGLCGTDAEHESLEDRPPLCGVRDLGVELHAVEATRLVGHAGDRAARRRGHQLEARGQRGDLVAVAHPHLEHAVALGGAEVLDPVEELRVAARADLGVAELAVVAPLDGAAELRRHRLHAVADAQHRHADRPDRMRRAQLVVLVGAGVAAAEDDPLGREGPHEVVGHVLRVDLAVHVRFAYAAGNQLGDLRAEIEDEDLVVHGAQVEGVVGVVGGVTGPEPADAAVARSARCCRKCRHARSIARPCSSAQK